MSIKDKTKPKFIVPRGKKKKIEEILAKYNAKSEVIVI